MGHMLTTEERARKDYMKVRRSLPTDLDSGVTWSLASARAKD